MIKAINEFFDKRIKHQQIKKYGEEPIKMALYLEREKGRCGPRIGRF